MNDISFCLPTRPNFAGFNNYNDSYTVEYCVNVLYKTHKTPLY